MGIKSLSRPRFEALCFMRHPAVKFIGEERYWYSDAEENVLGVVVFDRCDEDWLYVILGRDERARFRAIDQEINYKTDTEARNALHKKIEEYSQAGKNVFSQGLERKFQKTFLIFKPLVARSRLHPDFFNSSRIIRLLFRTSNNYGDCIYLRGSRWKLHTEISIQWF